MLATLCPSPEELRSYALGDSGEDAALRIEEHLARCPSCEETLAEFDSADDTLLRHLPLAASAGNESEAGWLSRLKKDVPGEGEDAAPPASHDLAETPAGAGDFLGSYRLLARIGRGGMGIVYRALHTQLDRVAAVKVLSPHLVASAAARARFDREIQIVGRLDHPGIVRATDAGRVGRTAYLVMEYVDGADLARLVRRGGPLPVTEACEAARQMAESLGAAHRRGAVHRDVKPSNVIVDRGGQVKLLDFGLAHLSAEMAADRDTSLGRLLGTLDYMAPEQAGSGEALDHRTDLYGLGATLFFLLTGRPPHGASGERPLLEQLRHIAEQDPPRVSELRPDVPAELDELIARLLARRPDDRPASAEEAAASLSHLAGGDLARRVAEIAPVESDPRRADAEEVAAAEASLAELLGEERDPAAPATKPERFARRFRGGVLVAAAVFLVAVCLGVVLVLQTPEGTLRIESEAENVRVELVDDQEEVQSLEIRQGDEETVLRAGRYRVRLAGGHDSLQVTPDEFTLRAGEEVIARIRYEKKEPVAEGGKPAADEPLYLGEPRSVWRDRFEREQESEAKVEAAKALVVLATGRPVQEQVAVWTRVGGELNESLRGGEGYRMPLDVLTGDSPTAMNVIGVHLPILSRAQRLPWTELAPELAAHFAEDEEPQAAIAGAVLAAVVTCYGVPRESAGTEQAVSRLLLVRESDTERWLTSRHLAATLAPKDPRAVEWLESVATKIVERPGDDRTSLYVNAWLPRAADVPVGADSIARILGAWALRGANSSTLEFFLSPPPERLADDAWQRRLLAGVRAEEVRRLWPEIAAELIKRIETSPENEQAPAAAIAFLFHFIDHVLDQLPAQGAPNFPKTKEALDRHLRVRYLVDGAPAGDAKIPAEITDAVTTDLLLRNYWRLTGVVPEYVRNGDPADPTLRAHVEELQRHLQLSGNKRFDRPATDLWIEAPYHTARTLLLTRAEEGADAAPDIVTISRGMRTNLDGFMTWPLVVMEHNCGESESRDSSFSNLFASLNSRTYGQRAAEPTFDGLRTSEALREIIRKTEYEPLRKQAIEAARNSPWLREELPETPKP